VAGSCYFLTGIENFSQNSDGELAANYAPLIRLRHDHINVL